MSEPAELVLYLPYPPTANNLFPTGEGRRRFASPEYKAWKQEAGYRLNNQLAGQTLPLPPPYAAVYEFRRPDNRRRDCSNLEKACSDLLVAHGVITDDCEIEDNRQRWVRDTPWEVRATIRTLA